MKKDNSFDNFFRDKLRGFQAQPDNQVWERIEAELREKKRRRVLPIWWRLSGVAAALIIGIGGYYILSGKHVSRGGSIVHTQPPHDTISPAPGSLQHRRPHRHDAVPVSEAVASQSQKDSQVAPVENIVQPRAQRPGSVDEYAPDLSSEKDRKTEGAIVSSEEMQKNHRKGQLHQIDSEKRQPVRSVPTINAVAQNQRSQNKETVANATIQTGDAQNRRQPETNSKDEIAIAVITEKNTANPQKDSSSERIPDNGTQKDMKSNGVAETRPETKKDSTGLPAGPDTLEELLHEKEKQVTSNEPESNRWQVTTVVAPVYFSSASNGSPLDSRFEKNKKSYTPTLSYGVGAKYAVSKKLAVRAGVHALKLDYNTSDLVFAQSTTARKLENVTPNLQGSMIDIQNKPSGQQAILGRSGLARSPSEYEGQVSQRIGYVEIPVELSYKVIDRKFGVEFIGGMSTLVLNDNQVLLLSDGLRMPIGEADNLASVHFSSNLGVGLRYNFLKSFQASVEPMLKYQFGTFSDNAGNFKPYFFGLYTGLSYKF